MISKQDRNMKDGKQSGPNNMQSVKIKAVIFDMFETLITHYNCPLYFGAQMALDAGISEEEFQKLWRPTEENRSIGKMTLEETIEMILKNNQCYSEERLNKIVSRRKATKKECFNNLHADIIPMLTGLKGQGIKVGLISNCFSEEAQVIRESILFPYFDVVCLSYEEGIQKPDVAIFHRCMERLCVNAEECVYVGDGGSNELETAQDLGMTALQAAWYLREGTFQPTTRMDNFIQLESPIELLTYVEKRIL